MFMGCSLTCVNASFLKKCIIFQIIYLYSTLLCTEPFKGHGSGKNSGWEEKIYFCDIYIYIYIYIYIAKLLRSLAKLFRSLANIFAFSRKTFAFPRKDICVLSQNQLSSDKLFLFTLQLAVVHTAPYVHNGAVHRVLF